MLDLHGTRVRLLLGVGSWVSQLLQGFEELSLWLPYSSGSPTLNGLTICFEGNLRKCFGEVVSALLVRGALQYVEFFVINVLPEPVPLAQELLGSVSNPVVGG